MKAFTDIYQSRKLAEILPLESADMIYVHTTDLEGDEHYDIDFRNNQPLFEDDVCAWSLAALLSILPFHLITNNQRYAFNMHKGLDKDGETYMFRYNVFNTDVCLYSTDYYNNPVDACYEMIIKLHEQKLL